MSDEQNGTGPEANKLVEMQEKDPGITVNAGKRSDSFDLHGNVVKNATHDVTKLELGQMTGKNVTPTSSKQSRRGSAVGMKRMHDRGIDDEDHSNTCFAFCNTNKKGSESKVNFTAEHRFLWKNEAHMKEYKECVDELKHAIKKKKYTASCFGLPPYKMRSVSEYPTSVGFQSFFLNFPNIIFVRRGSIFTSIFPQMIAAVGFSLLAAYIDADISSRGHVIISVPLSFLLVFKTQCSYAQYWEGRGHIGELVRATRTVCMEALSFFRKGGETVLTEEDKREDEYSLMTSAQICRLMKLYYFLVLEHLRTTGASSFGDSDIVLKANRKLLWCIVKHAGIEKEILGKPIAKSLLKYRDCREMIFEDPMFGKELRDAFEGKTTSQTNLQSSNVKRSKPLICLQMCMELSSRACDNGYLGPLRLHNIIDDLRWQMKAFNGIDKINKMLFPFPYAQLVKIFNFIFCFSLPFGIYQELQEYTMYVAMLVIVAFYGLDEIGELLEDPFGTLPNDLPVDKMGLGLLQDIDSFYLEHFKIDTVVNAQDRKFSNGDLRFTSKSTLGNSFQDVLEHGIADGMSDDTDRSGESQSSASFRGLHKITPAK